MNEKKSKKSILIVDDEEGILAFLEKTLSVYKYKVMKAKDGFECISRLRENKPDLIITDLMMPLLSGYALIKLIKENPLTKDIPIIMLSCKGSVEEVNKGLEFGALDHISKPIDLNLLLPKINSVLSKNENEI